MTKNVGIHVILIFWFY